MQELGWQYIVLDDCWAYGRNQSTGQLMWDVVRFPSGMPALAAWLHERSLLLGLYTSAGDQTCSSGGRPITVPGSRGFYDKDAQTFADWQVDYVKLDWCGDVKKKPWLGPQAHADFAAAMNATGRPMVLEVVAGYFFKGPAAIGAVANLWRFCEDHHDSWESTEENVACRADLGSLRGAPGGWPYMDVLTTGGAGCADGAHCPGQTEDEYRTEFAIWAITQSPLMVATDVRNLSRLSQQTLLNRELLALHQSVESPPGVRLSAATAACAPRWRCAVWARALGASRSSWLLALVNRGVDAPLNVSVRWSDLGWAMTARAHVRDVWAGRGLPMAVGVVAMPVAPHGTALLRVDLEA